MGNTTKLVSGYAAYADNTAAIADAASTAPGTTPVVATLELSEASSLACARAGGALIGAGSGAGITFGFSC